MPEAALFLRNITQPHSSKLMTTIEAPGLQWVVNLLQLKLAYNCEMFTPRVQSQEINVFF
jgi:hypothetical protein